MTERTDPLPEKLPETARRGLADLRRMAEEGRTDRAARSRMFSLLGSLPGQEGLLLQVMAAEEGNMPAGRRDPALPGCGEKTAVRALEDLHLLCTMPSGNRRLSCSTVCFIWTRFVRGELQAGLMQRTEAEELIRKKTGYSLRHAARYAKLTRLSDRWRDEWNEGRISLAAAVQISALSQTVQQFLWVTLAMSGDVSIGEKDVRKIRRLASQGFLSEERVCRELGR